MLVREGGKRSQCIVEGGKRSQCIVEGGVAGVLWRIGGRSSGHVREGQEERVVAS